MTAVLVVTALAIAAAAVQGTIGFGLALVMAPLLALIDHGFVPVALLVASFPLSLLVVGREWRHVDLGGVRWALAGRLPGTALGAAAVALLPMRPLALVVAGCVLAAVGLSLVSAIDVRPARASLLVAGAASGFMATTASVGGPPLALLYQRAGGPRIRATLAFYFVFGTVISVATLALAGQVTEHELVLAGELLPGTLVGFAISSRLRGLLDRGFMRPAVLAFAAVSALVLAALNIVG